MCCVLRAMRRPKSSLSPSGASKLDVVIASAPPTTAEKVSAVRRTRLAQRAWGCLVRPGGGARLGPSGGAGVNDHRRGFPAAGRHDLRPGRARGAKLGDLDEEVAPDAEA